MFSNIGNLIKNNIYLVSRQKVLLKRRKITSKKHKVAKKKFVQQNPNLSYTHELKILQIEKQLQRKKPKNQHLNELMDELFYPDVRYANQKLLEQNLLKMSSNNIQNNRKQGSQRQQGEIQDRNEQFDRLVQQIYLCQIPSQLFQLFLNNQQLFTHKHLDFLLNRLRSYFKNRNKIQQRITKKWKQSLDRLKLTDIQKKKRKRCPYIFIQQDELIRDEQWNKVVKQIIRKINVTTTNIANQKNQHQQSQESQNQNQTLTVDQSFYSLQNNCEVTLLIFNAAGYIPHELYHAVLQKSLTIVNMDENKAKSHQALPILSYSEKIKLFTLLALKSKTKSSLTKSLHIQTPENSQKHHDIVLSLGKKICQDVLSSPQCTYQDLGTIIKSGKGQYKFVNSMILDLAKPKILKFLSLSTLQRSIDYLYTFWLNGTCKDISLLEILKFDIYRKLPNTNKKTYLFYILSFIDHNIIQFKLSKISIPISDIYPRLTQSIAKYANKGQLTNDELKTFVNSIYQSYPLHNSQNKLNILQMVSTSIIKMSEGFKIQQIGQLLFRVTLMGYRSKNFTKFVFQRYIKQYKKLLKKYSQQKILLLSDKNSLNDLKQNNTQNLPSLNQILLQQSLICMLWCLIINYKHHNIELPLSEILEIYPLHIKSNDEMIMDLIQDLNHELEEIKLFPKLGQKSKIIKNKDSKKQILRRQLLTKTNTYKKYQYAYKESMGQQILKIIESQNLLIQEGKKEFLFDYLIRYSLVNQQDRNNVAIKIPKRWNDSVRDLITKREGLYESMKERFIQNYKELKTKNQFKWKISERLFNLLQIEANQKDASKRDTEQSNKSLKNNSKYSKAYQLL